MQVRQWKAWCFVLVLVAVLTPGVAFAQEGGGASGDVGPFTVVLSMIWDQLRLDKQAESSVVAPQDDMGPSISPDGLATHGSSNDLGSSISPDGLITPDDAGNDLGPFISPDGSPLEGHTNDLGAGISPDG